MCCSSHSISGRSSAKPRNSVIPAWVWAFTKPRDERLASRSQHVVAVGAGPTPGPIAAILPFSHRTPTLVPSSVASVTASPIDLA